jgi:hypothetical protein
MLPLGVLLRKALLEPRVEPREVQLVQFPQIGAISGIHRVEPLDELVGNLIPELFVAAPRQFRGHRHRILQRSEWMPS